MIQSTSAPPAAVGDAAAFLGFRFPTADLLDAGAGLFSKPARSSDAPFGRTWHDTFSEGAHGIHEGPWPRLEIAPGLARLFRRYDSLAESAAQRRVDEADALFLRRGALTRAQVHQPMVWAPDDDEAAPERPGRGVVGAWSRKSRARMIYRILTLDLAPLVAGDRLPVMVTLTLPGDWLAVTPTAAEAARKFDNFRRAWDRRWGAPSWLWKREFQRRGAPHWHLWVVPPGDPHEFRRWLSETWTRCLEIADPFERFRSLQAGTNVGVAEGLAARDPKRLAIYFLKESAAGEGKAYQNDPPEAWGSESVGRYWGRSRIEVSTREVDLDPSDVADVWRVLRHVRRAHRPTREITVPRVNRRTGVVRYRKVRRRSVTTGSAGWVAVNDGAAFASQLARWLNTRSTGAGSRRVHSIEQAFYTPPRLPAQPESNGGLLIV